MAQRKSENGSGTQKLEMPFHACGLGRGTTDEDGKRVIEDIKHVTSVELSEIMKKQTGGES